MLVAQAPFHQGGGGVVLVEQTPWVMGQLLLVVDGLFCEYLELGRDRPHSGWGGLEHWERESW